MILVMGVIVFLMGCGTKQENDGKVAQLSDSTATYNCEGEIIKVDFNNNVEPKTVDLFIRDLKLTLPKIKTGSETKYADGEVMFWMIQENATILVRETKKSLKCIEKK